MQKAIFKINKAKFPPTIEIEVDGVVGASCTGVVDDLAKILHLETISQRLKPEYAHVQQRIPQRR